MIHSILAGLVVPLGSVQRYPGNPRTHNLDVLRSSLRRNGQYRPIVINRRTMQDKAETQTVPGGNTEAFYREEGTLPKSRMLVEMHPDVARLAWRFNRWHHYVDYHRFASNRLVRRPDYQPPAENPYQFKTVARPEGIFGLTRDATSKPTEVASG